ncbi:hypothetical protein MMC25_002589 [Agyrium rufum]|nr:hypothetical protein [Agyrium rufum]
MSTSIENIVVEYQARIDFHRSFVLPARPIIHRPQPIRVTYADVDHRDDPHGPVIFVICGMFPGRWIVPGSADALAKSHKLRLICLDKPGLGGTGSVPLQYRIQNWLDIVPALLKHLSVPHVVFLSHSNGAIYQMNALLTLKNLLHPERPQAIFLAPWSHPNHSSTMRYLNFIPNALISSWDQVARNVIPVINQSIGVSKGVVRKVYPVKKGEDGEEKIPEMPGIDDDMKRIIMKCSKSPLPYMFVEATSGGSEEAMLCMKRGIEGREKWGLFEDYDEAVRKLVEQEKAARREGENNESHAKLEVRACYGSSDAMIGKTGAEWFEHCWQQDGRESVVDFRSEYWDCGHDNVLDSEKGYMHQMFGDISARWYGT